MGIFALLLLRRLLLQIRAMSFTQKLFLRPVNDLRRNYNFQSIRWFLFENLELENDFLIQIFMDSGFVTGNLCSFARFFFSSSSLFHLPLRKRRKEKKTRVIPPHHHRKHDPLALIYTHTKRTRTQPTGRLTFSPLFLHSYRRIPSKTETDRLEPIPVFKPDIPIQNPSDMILRRTADESVFTSLLEPAILSNKKAEPPH